MSQEIIRNPKGSKRDVQIHVAVTIMPAQAGVQILGEKENEITQLAVEVQFRYVPMTEDQFRRAFFALADKAIMKARFAGIVR